MSPATSAADGDHAPEDVPDRDVPNLHSRQTTAAPPPLDRYSSRGGHLDKPRSNDQNLWMALGRVT